MNRKTIKKEKKVLNVFETFSGIGAQNKALNFLKEKYNFDFKIAATSEWDIYANMSYNAIHNKYSYDDNKKIKESKEEILEFLRKFVHSKNGKTPINNSTLEKLPEKELYALYKAYKDCNNQGSITKITGKSLMQSLEDKNIEKINLITYSFPCQDLSVAGSLHGFNKGMAKELNTRSGLLWEIDRILNELEQLNKLPEFLLLENVVNMVSKKHEVQYKLWLQKLNDLGYTTTTYKINAREYGVPQNRNRIYALSVLNNPKKQKIESIQISKEKFEQITKIKKLNKILKEDYTIEKYRVEAFEARPNNTPSRQKIKLLNRVLNDPEKDVYTRTITTKQDRHPNAGIVLLRDLTFWDEKYVKTKCDYRFITPREGFILMGFSENDFEKVKKLNLRNEKLYQQCGNSIVVEVLIHVFKKMYESW